MTGTAWLAWLLSQLLARDHTAAASWSGLLHARIFCPTTACWCIVSFWLYNRVRAPHVGFTAIVRVRMSYV